MPWRRIWTGAGVLFLVVSGGLLAQEDEVCLMCHADAENFEGLPNASTLTVPEGVLVGSMHEGFGCVDCHQDLAGSDDFPHAEQLEVPSCGICHEEIQEVFDQSLHGYALARGNARAPSCASCHGAHDVLRSKDPHSRTHKAKLLHTCENCHGTAGLLTDHIVKLPQSVSDYAQSVHGQGTERGIMGAAACADCHGVHDLRGAGDPQSSIHPKNVAATCGQCHPDTQVEYEKSIHGRALYAGVTDSPTCTGCHGEHMILSPHDPDATVSAGRQAVETCGRCHDDPVIIAKYNLKGAVVASYVDSYHGWATQLRSAEAASCIDCHTAHSVLPAIHPDSTISQANVTATCQRCHPRADEKFAASYSHEAVSLATNPINRMIRNVYVWMIVAVIGGMLLHNLVIVNYYAMERRRAAKKADCVQRMDGSQLLQHLFLSVSFIMLCVTGFALRFPEAWWVDYLGKVGMTELARSNLHRFFAIMLIVTSIAHLIYVSLSRRGKSDLQAMLPAVSDIRGFWANLRFHTWRSRQPARFGRYDYTQKAEYWALVWGTFVMAVTGIVLWYPAIFVRMFPAWVVSASQTVHYYEAWLAMLAVVVWHGFFVMLHPEQYPMSWTWLNGKMTLDEVKHHHSGWYEDDFAGMARGEQPPEEEAPHESEQPPAVA